MTVEECRHGNPENRCEACRSTRTWDSMSRVSAAPIRSSGRSGFSGGGEVKQDVLEDLCDLLGMPVLATYVGSSIPKEVFREAARRVGVPIGSMPEITQAIIEKAGMRYSPDYDSRATLSGGGSTVTLEGMQALRTALRTLL